MLQTTHEETYKGHTIRITFCSYTNTESWQIYQDGKEVRARETGCDLGYTKELIAEAKGHIDWLEAHEEVDRREEYMNAVATLLTRLQFAIAALDSRTDLPMEWVQVKLAYEIAKEKLDAIPGD